MPYARILFDVASYRAEAGHMDSAVKGDVVDLPAAELDRLVELGAAEKASAKDAKAFEDARAAAPDDNGPKTPALDPAGDGKVDQDAPAQDQDEK